MSQSFGYDDLYQITAAKGTYGFGPGKQNNYTNAFSYDTIGNMTRKEQVNQIIQPSATVTLPKETNYVLSYTYGANQPHAVIDAGGKIYSYDPSGNMIGWKSKTSGQKRTIIWNEENRVKEIDDNGKAVYFLYDDAGERVVKRGQYGETLYINRFYAVKNGELGTKHIFAGETRVLSKLVKTPNASTANTTSIPGSNGLDQGRGKKLGIIKRLPDGTTTTIVQPIEKDEFYYHGDHLGSSNMITDAYGEVYQHLEYFPYGESWIEEGGSHGGNLTGYKFTGKELDPETGLYYYGARYYDPVLSKWISADPILGKYLPTRDKQQDQNLASGGGVFNPVNLNLYKYAGNNPVRITDPDGRAEEKHEFDKSLVGKDKTNGLLKALNFNAQTTTDYAAGTAKSGLEASVMNFEAGGKNSSKTLEGKVELWSWRAKLEGGTTNIFTKMPEIEGSAKIAGVEGEISGTINIGKVFVKLTAGGSLASLGAEGKLGAHGIRGGVHIGVGAKAGIEWGTRDLAPSPSTGGATPISAGLISPPNPVSVTNCHASD